MFIKEFIIFPYLQNNIKGNFPYHLDFPLKILYYLRK